MKKNPILSVSAPSIAFLGEEVVIDGTASYGIIHNWTIDFGDSSVISRRNIPIYAVHKYATAGEYFLLVVADDLPPVPMKITILPAYTPLSVEPPDDITEESPDNQPVDVTLPALSVSGGIGPYTTTYDTPDGDKVPGETFEAGVGFRSCPVLVEDSQGSQAQTSLAVTVTYIPPPPEELVVTAPADQTAQSTDGNPVVVTYPDATVEGGETPYAVTYTSPAGSAVSGSAFPVGITVVTVTAVSADGQIATDTFNITVSDISTPLLTVIAPPDQNAVSTDGNPVAVTFPNPTIAGGREPYEIDFIPDSGSLFSVGTTEVTVHVDSFDDQSASDTFNVIVTLSASPPVVTAPANQTATTSDGNPVVVNYPPATSTGGVAPVTITYSKASGTTFPLGVTTVTVTATDNVGQVDTATFTVTVTWDDIVIPPGVGPHDYFNSLIALPSCVKSYTMRSQAQLNQYSNNGTPTSVHATYSPATDTYFDAQDAAKILIPAGTTNFDQVRFPISQTSGIIDVVWDAYWGIEFKTNRGGISVNKTFMVSSPCTSSANAVMMELNVSYTVGDAAKIGRLGGRHYLSCNGTVASPTTSTNPLAPRLVNHDILPNKWYRFVWRFTLGDPHCLFSAWFMNEDQDAQLYYSGLKLDSNMHALQQFWLEWNTSQTCSGCGNRIGYARNLVVLKNLGDVTPLLVKPIRG